MSELMAALARGIEMGDFEVFAPTKLEAATAGMGPVETAYYLREMAEERAAAALDALEESGDEIVSGEEVPGWMDEPEADPVEEWLREAAEFPGHVSPPF